MKRLRIALLLIIGMLVGLSGVYWKEFTGLRQPLLLSAAGRGNIGEMKLALFLGADVNATQEGLNALSSAAFNSDPESVRFLLTHGAMVNDPGCYGCPLGTAAFFGHMETAKTLIAAGEDVNAKRGAESPLMVAARGGFVQVAELFIDSGADLSRDGEQAMKNAIIAGHPEVVKLLIDTGIDVRKLPSESDSTLFEYAGYVSRPGDRDAIIELLAAAGARK